MDKISLTGMEFFGYHGVLPEETRLGQRFIVDLTMELDLRQAGENDDLEATINYAEVYADIKVLVEGAPVKTLECLGERICQKLYAKYQLLEHLSLTIHKPGAPVAGIFKDVAVTLER